MNYLAFRSSLPPKFTALHFLTFMPLSLCMISYFEVTLSVFRLEFLLNFKLKRTLYVMY